MQHVKNFSPTTLTAMKSANVEQLNIQKYVLQDGDIARQAEFLLTKRNKANASRCSAAKPRRASSTGIMMR